MDPADQRPPKRGRHLFRKYVLIFATLVSGSLLVSGLVEILSSYEENKRVLVRVQQERAVAAAGTIRQFIKDTERQVRWTLQPIWAGFVAAPNQRRDDFNQLLHLAPEVADVGYLDQWGREQIRVSRRDLTVQGSQVDYSRAAKFLEATEDTPYFSPVYFRSGSEPYMTIAMREDGPEAGVVVVEVNLKLIWDVILDIQIGQAGHAYVVDSDGLLVAHPDMSLVLQKRDLTSLPQVRAALLSRSGEDLAEGTIARDLQGRQVLTARESIEPFGWWVFVEQPLDEAFAPVYASILRTALLLFLGLLSSILASLFFARKMTDPLYALRAGVARIGAGTLDHRIEVRTDDEIEEVAEEFNTMAARLEASYADLEQKVEERTRDLAEALERLKELGLVSEAVNSSLDLEQVLTTILTRAVELSGADGGTIYEFLEATQEFHLRAADRMPVALVEAIGQDKGSGGPIVAQAAALRAPVNVADLTEEPDDPVRRALQEAGFRALLVVPLLREGRLFGALVVRRKTPGRFPQQIVDLLQTVASQSVVAIQHARLFQEITDKGRQLEAASRHKSEFLANMSHELRTPLNSVIGFSEILLERLLGDLSGRQDESIRDILAAGQHLLSLINDMLDLSKVEAGRMELQIGQFSLANVLEDGRTMLKERAGRQGIALGLDVDPSIGPIEADERKVKQVVYNLLSNAVKFTPAGGRVDMTASRVGEEIHVAVRDSGAGIAAEDLERIFEEFHQLDRGSGYR